MSMSMHSSFFVLSLRRQMFMSKIVLLAQFRTWLHLNGSLGFLVLLAQFRTWLHLNGSSGFLPNLVLMHSFSLAFSPSGLMSTTKISPFSHGFDRLSAAGRFSHFRPSQGYVVSCGTVFAFFGPLKVMCVIMWSTSNFPAVHPPFISSAVSRMFN